MPKFNRNNLFNASPKTWTHIACAFLVLAWAVVVLWVSLGHLEGYLSPTVGLLYRLALCGLCAYSFLMSGFRVIGRSTNFARLDPLARTCIEAGIGIALAMLATFLAGSVGLIRTELAWLVIGLPLLGSHRKFLGSVRERWEDVEAGFGQKKFLLVALLATLSMGLAESLAPAVSQDALVYHLAVPAKFVETGWLHYVSGNFYSAFPMNVEMLFTLGLLIDGDQLAKWFHWMLGVAAAGTVASIARQLVTHGWRRKVDSHGALAAALFVTIPTVVLISGWAYVDLGVVFYSSLSTLMLILFLERRVSRSAGIGGGSTVFLVLAAVFAGVAAGCKYTAALQGIILGIVVVYDGFKEGEKRQVILSRFLLVGGISFCLVLPWYLKNLITTGNPVFPFAYSIFGGIEWSEERAFVLTRSLSEWGGSRSGLDLIFLPWDVSVAGKFFSQENFDGVIGGAFLVGLPFLIAGLWSSRSYRVVAFCLSVHGVLWMATTHQIRFLLPALALAAALLAVSIGSLRDRSLRATASGVIYVILIANVLLIAVRFASQNPLSAVLGLESRDEYMTRALPGDDYAIFQHIENELPSSSRILFGSCGNPGYLCKRPYHSDAYFENTTLKEILDLHSTPEDVFKEMRSRGFTHLLFRFDTVFDLSERRSEISVDGQVLLGKFLNAHAKLELKADATMLYRLVDADALEVHDAG